MLQKLALRVKRHSGVSRNPAAPQAPSVAKRQNAAFDAFCRFAASAPRRKRGRWIPAYAGMTPFLLALLFFTFPAHAVVPTQERPVAVLRALDKMTARVEVLEIPTGKPVSFGTLIISVRACRVTPPEEAPESGAFLEISELKPGEKDTPVFHGWMFSSSPALSAMEHPVYDMWLIGCKSAAVK
jgi:hypothetical protein